MVVLSTSAGTLGVCLSCLVGWFLCLQCVPAQTLPCHLVLCCHLVVDLVEEFAKFTHCQDLVLDQVEAEAEAKAEAEAEAQCQMVS